MARPLSFVRLDIARFGVELSDRSDTEIVYWVKSFYRSLALQDPKLNEFAASLLEESHEYRNAESERVKAYLRRKNMELPVITTQNTTKQNKAKQSKTIEHLFFSDSKFKEAWTNWEKVRKEKAGEFQLKKLLKLSNENLETAIAIMEESIGNGWKGIFELKGVNNGTSNDGRSPRRKRLDEDAHRITELAERIAGNDRGLHPAHVPIGRPSGSD